MFLFGRNILLFIYSTTHIYGTLIILKNNSCPLYVCVQGLHFSSWSQNWHIPQLALPATGIFRNFFLCYWEFESQTTAALYRNAIYFAFILFDILDVLLKIVFLCLGLILKSSSYMKSNFLLFIISSEIRSVFLGKKLK